MSNQYLLKLLLKNYFTYCLAYRLFVVPEVAVRIDRTDYHRPSGNLSTLAGKHCLQPLQNDFED